METYYPAEAEDLIAASRTARLLAWAVDLILFLVLAAVISRFEQLQIFEVGSSFMVYAYALTLLTAVAALYVQVYLLVVFGQTIGKRAMGIRVITPEGFVPNLGRMVFRRLLPMATLLLLAEVVERLFCPRWCGANSRADSCRKDRC